VIAPEYMDSAPRLSELLDGFAEVPPALDCTVSDIALDSRAVQPGGLFLACRGFHAHGLQFVERALAHGAGAVAWEPDASVAAPVMPAGVAAIPVTDLARRASVIAGRFFREPSTRLQVAGVTGTNGKSSVTLMLAEACEQLGMPAGVIGTLGAGHFGELGAPGLTTPDAVGMQRLLAGFRDSGLRVAAMEASSHGLHQGRVDGVRFRAAVFTNLTRDHLDYHGSEQAYGEAKARLFARPGLAAAVVNLDDAFGRELPGRLEPGVAAFGYTLGDTPAPAHCRLLAARVHTSPRGLDLHIGGDCGEAHVKSALAGRFNAANLLAVLGALLAFDVPFAAAARTLGALHPAPGRMECFGGGEQPLVIVDYAHTPDALEKVLTAAREHAGGRVIAVFGCGGERDRGKRGLMGEIAARRADLAIVTDDNPRGEDGDAIVADILAGVPGRGRLSVERDRRRAIAAAIGEARPGDTVVVAGKGHEAVQIVGSERRPFDDRAVVRELLRGR
jgi:UDP-N-acetylmuramoyl-L-alanyl-D-glutamate--2,6-diaminopimelate ligase